MTLEERVNEVFNECGFEIPGISLADKLFALIETEKKESYDEGYKDAKAKQAACEKEHDNTYGMSWEEATK